MSGSERGIRTTPLGAGRLGSRRSGPGSEPPWRLAPVAGVLVALALLGSAPASAQQARRVGLSLTVSHASSHPGPVDPAAARLHESLRDEFRYESLRVIERRRLSLRTGEIGGLDLPSGKRVRVRPLHLGPAGVLLAVDIENTLHTDMRLPDRRPVVIGVDRYQGGKLILTVESELPPE
ncbi:hypothetical protein KJ059_05850 [Myxococcota bacterium]|nr:hypothetical protein [Myxococcota bacterium]MCZ7620072.1 hypothetical protein [Myxococcota bacterium]